MCTMTSVVRARAAIAAAATTVLPKPGRSVKGSRCPRPSSARSAAFCSTRSVPDERARERLSRPPLVALDQLDVVLLEQRRERLATPAREAHVVRVQLGLVDEARDVPGGAMACARARGQWGLGNAARRAMA